MDDPAWAERVFLRYDGLRNEDNGPDQPVRRLILAKRAIAEVTRSMCKETEHQKAITSEDRLGWTMRFLRAAEGLRLRTMQKGVVAYPHLTKLAEYQDPNVRLRSGLTKVREHAIELARGAVTDELKELSKGCAAGEEQNRAHKKENILVKLKRLMPGASSGVNAMASDQGEITTDPMEMANILRQHWGRVFTRKPTNGRLRNAWLNNVFPGSTRSGNARDLHAVSSERWTIRRKDVAEAIKQTGNTMPGPDCVPYKAWRQLGDLGIDILYEVALTMAEDDIGRIFEEAYAGVAPQGDHDFNLGVLCCLPKKASGTDAKNGEYYKAEATRPLCIVNTDNRILASAARIRWEPIFNEWVSDMQRGFLHGRSMLSNVVDIEMEAMRISLKSDKGAVVLFDFQAAFPSLSHEYMMSVLGHIGVPTGSLSFVKALYNRTKCVVSCKGGRHEGFVQTAGIRQGCPLSPLLFAVTVDLLLRKLSATSVSSMIRAFADDTAMTFPDFFADGGAIMDVFRQFEEISGMALNLPKTVAIPLWLDPMRVCEREIAERLQGWTGVRVEDASMYLGFYIGPGKGTRSWDKPLQKYSQRVSLWSAQGTGLQYSALTYNIFAMSVLSFVSQLESPPEAAYQLEEQELKGAAKGPHRWVTPADLWHLSELYGQAQSFQSLRIMAWASKVRVAAWENLALDGRKLMDRAFDLETALGATDYVYRKHKWSAWYAAAPALTLRHAVRQAERAGINQSSIQDELARGTPRPWTQRIRLQVKCGYQQLVTRRLIGLARPDPEHRMRMKLER